MLFDSTTLLLRNILQLLESGDEPDWDDHLEYGNQCVYELSQMSRPERRKYNGHVATVFDRASRAIPHVKLMNRAIRQKHRAQAIEHGRAAVSEMTGRRHASADQTPVSDTCATAITVVLPAAEHRVKAIPKRSAATKRKSARASG